MGQEGSSASNLLLVGQLSVLAPSVCMKAFKQREIPDAARGMQAGEDVRMTRPAAVVAAVRRMRGRTNARAS